MLQVELELADVDLRHEQALQFDFLQGFRVNRIDKLYKQCYNMLGKYNFWNNMKYEKSVEYQLSQYEKFNEI